MLRGLAVLLPPVLTIVIIIWVASTVNLYVLAPINTGISKLSARVLLDTREASNLKAEFETGEGEQELPALEDLGGRRYRVTDELAELLAVAPDDAKLEELVEGSWDAYVSVALGNNGPYIPLPVYRSVSGHVSPNDLPKTALGFYELYVHHEVLSAWVLSFGAVLALIIGVYFLGRLLALGLGRALWQMFEHRMVFRLPLVRNVYSSVKQVTDFLLTEREEIAYRRVVAIQYPRKGIWSIGLVTGESMREIHDAAGEEVLSVLIPSSPMPVTGYTVTVRKSEVIDLDMSVDQAFQFCISCGVVVPPQQLSGLTKKQPALKDLEPSEVDSEASPVVISDMPHTGG